MKNTKKAWSLLLCGAFCALILSLVLPPTLEAQETKAKATKTKKTKAAANPKSMDGLGNGTLALGEWIAQDDKNDKGDSTAVLTTAEEVVNGKTVTVHTIKGNVTTKFQYGYAGWRIEPDDATLTLLKTAKALSFMVYGDGKRYAIKYKTSDVRDYEYHEYLFNTEPGEWVTIEVPMGFFMQPTWGKTPVRLKPENVIGVEWQTHESWRKVGNSNPYEVKIAEFRIF